jgi:hypothetical protein
MGIGIEGGGGKGGGYIDKIVPRTFLFCGESWGELGGLGHGGVGCGEKGGGGGGCG